MSAVGERSRRHLLAPVVIAVTLAATFGISHVSRSSHASMLSAPVAAPAAGGESASRLTRVTLARAALRHQQLALRDGSRAGYLKTWDLRSAAARRRASSVYANLQSLGTVVSRMRYLTATPTASAAAVPLHTQRGAWSADVALRWRLRGYAAREARAVVTVTFVRRRGAAYIADMTSSTGHRVPVWLLRHLDVRHSRRTLAAALSPGQANRLHRLLVVATSDLDRVIPHWHGKLVAFEPASASAFEAMVAGSPGAYDGIAAVTSTVDGSTRPRAPVAVFVNPANFDPLSQVGAHVVITHEATHVATGAATARLPLWVAEGFADYVGVGSVDIPLTVSAAAVVRDLRRHRVPAALPSNSAFATTGFRLEVAYEQAWLACRLIAERYGRARLVDFYFQVVAKSGGVADAVRTQLGTSLPHLTQQWRRSLRTLARAG